MCERCCTHGTPYPLWGRCASVCLLVAAFVAGFGLPASGANPVPFVNQPLTPMTVAPGSGQFTLTVNGTGFVSGSVV